MRPGKPGATKDILRPRDSSLSLKSKIAEKPNKSWQAVAVRLESVLVEHNESRSLASPAWNESKAPRSLKSQRNLTQNETRKGDDASHELKRLP
jgi:hypothetical protein